MKITLVFLTIAFALSSFSTWAEDLKFPSITLKTGKTYEGVTLKKKSETQVSIIHSSGVATAELAELSDEVAEKLGYSKEKVEALEKARINAQEEQNAAIANALDFKGLRLRLPLTAVPALVVKTLWSYDDMDILLKKVDLKNPNTTLDLDADGEEERRQNGYSSDQASEFSSIGRDGVGDNAFWYAISDTRAEFLDGQLAQIKVYGPAWSADKLKSNTLRWLELAEAGLREKYGKPTEVIIPISKFNILNAESGYVVYVSKWKIRNQTICLGVSESDSTFTPMIVLYDDALKLKLDTLGEGKSHLK